jgi:predicted secreted hydrolase
MALKMTPAEALTESMMRIPVAERPPAALWTPLVEAALTVASAHTAQLIYTLLGGGASSWAAPLSGPPRFPADHAPHLDAGPEWYWLTANLAPKGVEGPHFGLVVCLQRQRILSEHVEREGGWTKVEAQLVQSQTVLTISDLGGDPAGGQVVQQSRNVWTPLGGEVGFGADPFLFQCGPDYFEGTADVLPLRLHVEGEAVAVDLTLTSDLPAENAFFLQGAQGLTAGPRSGFYYSWPQLRIAGSLVAAGVPYEVEGTGWIDHECMATIIPAGAAPPYGINGWTFCAFNLSNGDALVLAGSQAGVLQTHLAAPYGFYVRREGDGWVPIDIAGQIEMDAFLPLTEHCVMLPIAWRGEASAVRNIAEPLKFAIETKPFLADGGFVGPNLAVMGETPVAVKLARTVAPAGPPVILTGVGYCESVGYEPAPLYIARALAALDPPP